MIEFATDVDNHAHQSSLSAADQSVSDFASIAFTTGSFDSTLTASPTVANLLAAATQEKARQQLRLEIERELRPIFPEAFVEAAAPAADRDSVFVPCFLRSAALHADPATASGRSPIATNQTELSRAILQTLQLATEIALPLATPVVRDCAAATVLRTAVQELISLRNAGAVFCTDEFVSLPGRRSLLTAACCIVSLSLKSFLFHGVVYGVGDVERTQDFTSKLLSRFSDALADLVEKIKAKRAAAGRSDENNAAIGDRDADDSSPSPEPEQHQPSRRESTVSSSVNLLGPRRASSLRKRPSFVESPQQQQRRRSSVGPQCPVTLASNSVLFFSISSALLSVNCVAFVDVLLSCVQSCDSGGTALLELVFHALKKGEEDEEDDGGVDADGSSTAHRFFQRRVLLCGASLYKGGGGHTTAAADEQQTPSHQQHHRHSVHMNNKQQQHDNENPSSSISNNVLQVAASGNEPALQKALLTVLETASSSPRFLFVWLFAHRSSALSRLLWDMSSGGSCYFRCVVGDLVRAGCCGESLMGLLTCADDDIRSLQSCWSGLLCSLDALRTQNRSSSDSTSPSSSYSSSVSVRAVTALSWVARFLLCNASAGLARTIVRVSIHSAKNVSSSSSSTTDVANALLDRAAAGAGSTFNVTSTASAAAAAGAANNESISRVMCEIVFGIPTWVLEIWRRRGASHSHVAVMERMLLVQAQLADAGLDGPADLAPLNPSRCQPVSENHYRTFRVEQRRRLHLAKENDAEQEEDEEEIFSTKLLFFFASKDEEDAESEEMMMMVQQRRASPASGSGKSSSSPSSPPPAAPAPSTRHAAPPFRLWNVSPLTRPSDADDINAHVGTCLSIWDSSFLEQFHFLSAHLPHHEGEEMRTNWSAQRAPQHVVAFAMAQKRVIEFVAQRAKDFLLHGMDETAASAAARNVSGGGGGLKRRPSFSAMQLAGGSSPNLLLDDGHIKTSFPQLLDDPDDDDAAADDDDNNNNLKPSPSSIVAKIRARVKQGEKKQKKTGAAADSPSSDLPALSPARSSTSVDHHIQRMRHLRDKQEQQRQAAIEAEPSTMSWTSPSPTAAAAAVSRGSKCTATGGWALTPSPNRRGNFQLMPGGIVMPAPTTADTPAPAPSSSSSTMFPPINTSNRNSPSRQLALTPQPYSSQLPLIVSPQRQNGGPAGSKQQNSRERAHRRVEKHKREVRERFREIERRKEQREKELEPEIDRWYAHLERDETRDLRLRMWTAVHQKRQTVLEAQRAQRMKITHQMELSWLVAHEADVRGGSGRGYGFASEQAAAWQVLLQESERSVVMATSYEQRREIDDEESAAALRLFRAAQRSRLEHEELQERRYGAVDEAVVWAVEVLFVAARGRHAVVETEQRRARLERPEAQERWQLRMAEQRHKLEAAEAELRRCSMLFGLEAQRKVWRGLMQREQRARLEAQERTQRRWIGSLDERRDWLLGIEHPKQRSYLVARSRTMMRIWREVEGAVWLVNVMEVERRERAQAECAAGRRLVLEAEAAARLQGILEAAGRSHIDSEQDAAWWSLHMEERVRRAEVYRVPMPHLSLMMEVQREEQHSKNTNKKKVVSHRRRSSFIESTAAGCWAIPAIVQLLDTKEHCDDDDGKKSDPVTLIQYRNEVFRMLLIGGAEHVAVKARAEMVQRSESNRLQMLRAAEHEVWKQSNDDDDVKNKKQKKKKKIIVTKNINVNEEKAAEEEDAAWQRELSLRHEAVILRSLKSSSSSTAAKKSQPELYLFDKREITEAEFRQRFRSSAGEVDRLATLQRTEAELIQQEQQQKEQHQKEEQHQQQNEDNEHAALSQRSSHSDMGKSLADAETIDTDAVVIEQLEAKLAEAQARYAGELADFDLALGAGGNAADDPLLEMRKEMEGLRDTVCGGLQQQIADAKKKQQHNQNQNQNQQQRHDAAEKQVDANKESSYAEEGRTLAHLQKEEQHHSESTMLEKLQRSVDEERRLDDEYRSRTPGSSGAIASVSASAAAGAANRASFRDSVNKKGSSGGDGATANLHVSGVRVVEEDDTAAAEREKAKLPDKESAAAASFTAVVEDDDF